MENCCILVSPGNVVKFHINGATGPAPTDIKVATDGGTIGVGNLPGSAGLTYTDHTFGGWYSVPEKTGGTPFTDDTPVTGIKTVYARWFHTTNEKWELADSLNTYVTAWATTNTDKGTVASALAGGVRVLFQETTRPEFMSWFPAVVYSGHFKDDGTAVTTPTTTGVGVELGYLRSLLSSPSATTIPFTLPPGVTIANNGAINGTASTSIDGQSKTMLRFGVGPTGTTPTAVYVEYELNLFPTAKFTGSIAASVAAISNAIVISGGAGSNEPFNSTASTADPIATFRDIGEVVITVADGLKLTVDGALADLEDHDEDPSTPSRHTFTAESKVYTILVENA